MRTAFLLLLAALPAAALDGVEAGFRKADALMEAGEYASARSELAAAKADLGPDDPRQVRVQERMGAVYLREGKLLAARGAFTAALKTAQRLKAEDAVAARAYAGMGLCLRREGKDEYALRFFQRALALKPDEGTRMFADDQAREIQGQPPTAAR